MLLSAPEVERFYRVWWRLLWHANERLSLVEPFPREDPLHLCVSPPGIDELRTALWERDDLLREFVDDNPGGLGPDDLALAASWKHRIATTFFVLRHLKKHTIFLHDTKAAYGVVGLNTPIEELVPPPPALVKAVLLPFEDRITYDTMFTCHGITFGPGISRRMEEDFRDCQEAGVFVTSLVPASGAELDQRIGVGNELLLKAFARGLALARLSASKADEHLRNVRVLAERLKQSSSPRPLRAVTPDDLREALAQLPPSFRVSFRRFARFLEQSERVDARVFSDMPELK